MGIMQYVMSDELKDAFLSVSLSEPLSQALDAAAAEQGRTRSEMARRVLRQPIRLSGVKLAGSAHLYVAIPSSMMETLAEGAEEAGWPISEYVRFNLAQHPEVNKHFNQPMRATKEKVIDDE